MIFKIQDSNFRNEVINEKKLVVVDFSASWCRPCKMMKLILEEIDNKYGEIKVVNIDVDTSPHISQRYNIRTIPNIKFFKNGIVIDEIIGFVPKSEIEHIIEKNA